jgi:putative heme transporter
MKPMDEGEPAVSEPNHSPGSEPDDVAPARPPRRSWLPRNVKITLMVVFLFFVGEYILLPELASARREYHQLSHLNFLWLVLGVLLELGALAAYAELTRTVLSPDAPPRWRVFRINMWALAVSHVLPGGTVPGTAASYRLLTESDVSGSTAAFGLATQGIGSAVVLNVIFWLSLLISIPLQGYNPLYGFAAILGVLLLAIFAGLVFLLTRGEKQAATFVSKVADRLPFVRPETVTSLVQKVADRMKILLSSSDLLVRAGIWAAANWLLDAASLWVFLLAFGAHISPIDVLVAYGLANILAVIPVTPSGLGVVELTIVAVLTRFGVAGGVAAAGVLSWRLVNFWLPIPFGGVSYLSLRLSRARAHSSAGANPVAS